MDGVRKCEQNLVKAMMSSSRVRILVEALRRSGCPFEPGRHLSCEPCNQSLDGGYDQPANQIVICSNKGLTESKVEEVLAHELVHMNDFCRFEVDFANRLDHLACSEIRAANLASCSAPNLWENKTSCVKRKARKSVQIISGLDGEQAGKIVDKVFHKCSSDLEPLGRHISSPEEGCLALAEFKRFSYKCKRDCFSFMK